MMTPQHRPLALIGVLLVGASPATAQTQRHLPAFAPGEQGSSNVHLMSHIPLGRMFTVGDVEVEQELSRPYAYLGRMHGITHSSGFSVINLTIPAKASVLYTWQIENAPAVKRAALAKLSDQDLKSVFLEHLSVNDDITTFVRTGLSGGAARPNDPKQWVNFREPPFIFRSSLPASSSTESLDDQEKALLQARQIIESNPARQKEAVDTIARLLAGSTADSKWPVATYAALACKVSLRDGDYARAKDLLQSALKAKPDDTELQYLSRILERFGG